MELFQLAAILALGYVIFVGVMIILTEARAVVRASRRYDR